MKTKVGISNRHVHLTEEVYNKLFNEELTKRNDLNQPGEFASNMMVTLKTDKGEINNVRVLGPLRNYNQVEITKTDAYKLGINPPVRKSGDIKHTPGITLIGPLGKVNLNEGVIIAERHVHMTKEDASKYGFSNEEKVNINISSIKPGIIEAHIKIKDQSCTELHLDTDDANAFMLNNEDVVEVCGK